MNTAIVLTTLAAALGLLFAWAFRHLPDGRWQVLAVLPRQRQAGDTWQGINLTYYGFFNAMAVAAGTAVVIVLAGAAGLPLRSISLSLLAVLAVAIPASKIVNRIIEGHWHGFTVAGGCFTGIVAGPWILWGVLHLSMSAHDAPSAALMILGALAPAYALGEGIGRLACISFGCCYGRPIEDCPRWLQRAFARRAFRFDAPLKKACYEHGYNGRPLLPVQAITAVISSLAGLIGMAFFLYGYFRTAFVFAMATTQAWRFLSEFLRADYRGEGRISSYQWMAIVGAAYAVVLVAIWPVGGAAAPDVSRGLKVLWTPEALIVIEAVAVFVFGHMGVSSVTTSQITLQPSSKAMEAVSKKAASPPVICATADTPDEPLHAFPFRA
jgi:hypothetical protein